MIIHKSNTEELNKWLFESDDRGIICYGAGGILKNDFIKKYEKWVRGVIDENKKGQQFIYNQLNISIKNKIEDFDKQIWENNCLVITTNFFPEIVEKIKLLKLEIHVFVYPVFSLNEMSKKEIINKRIVDFSAFYLNIHNGEKTIEDYSIELQNKIEQGMVIIPKVVFFLTTRCTLKCKECTARIPYMPLFDVPWELLKQDIDRTVELVDEIEVVQFAGGESLLYPDFEKLINYVVGIEKIRTIHFVTNGTIIPSTEKLDLLANEKCFVYVSDYSGISKIQQLKRVFEERKIKYVVLEELKWKCVGDISKRNKSSEQKMWEYWQCGNGYGCKMVYDGKLFACDKSCRIFVEKRLNPSIVCDYSSEADSVSLIGDDEIVRKQIMDLYTRRTIEACDFCDFANLRAKEIEPAEQL